MNDFFELCRGFLSQPAECPWSRLSSEGTWSATALGGILGSDWGGRACVGGHERQLPSLSRAARVLRDAVWADEQEVVVCALRLAELSPVLVPATSEDVSADVGCLLCPAIHFTCLLLLVGGCVCCVTRKLRACASLRFGLFDQKRISLKGLLTKVSQLLRCWWCHAAQLVQTNLEFSLVSSNDPMVQPPPNMK